MLLQPDTPCHKCPKRKMGCHNSAVCSDWGAYEKAMVEWRAEINAKRVTDYIITSYYKTRSENIRRATR